MPEIQENNHQPAAGQFSNQWQTQSPSPNHTDEQADAAKRLELALEGGSLGFWDWNVATGMVDYSERWCAMVGYRQDELAPDFSTWKKLVHPEDLPKAVAAIENYFAGKTEQYAIEFRMQHKQGNWLWIASRGRVFAVDAEGNPQRAVGTHQDITDRKLTELALAQEKDQFQSAMEYSAIGMALVSLKGEWLMVNPAICRIVGYSMEELLATDFQSITHPDDLQSDLGYIEKVLAGEIPNYEMEKRYFHKDGRIIWVLLSVSLARNPDGSPRHFISQIQDITERKNAEIRANIYLQELERSNQELDDFAYIASHDLKEPLRAINNHSQSLLRSYEAELDEAGNRKLNRLVFLTRRMEVLIDDLLQFSRLGRLDTSTEDIDLKELLTNEVATVCNSEEHPEIKVSLCDEWPSVRGNRASIAIIFRNLIGNAIKYNDSAEKRIEIGLLPEMQRSGQTLRNVYYIRDNGIGIDPDFHELIFGMFKRLNNEKAYGPGTGAGLAFVKRIIDQLKGVIFVQSQTGEGATFYFTLGSEQ
jgi:PAS domain S-box-containing protein